ncbi:hypothetical protein AAHA92_01061 [Salvia divinorum]|uniref:Uncharacterized protein n=1 Tax=Salvia divinorum TaxID=28513 RepID=A0ABD1INX4_SALDI
MADIAILVAEEYERRVKNSRKVNGEEIELFSCVGFLGQRLKGSSSSWMKDITVKNFEARSNVTAAATNGFFSA